MKKYYIPKLSFKRAHLLFIIILLFCFLVFALAPALDGAPLFSEVGGSFVGGPENSYIDGDGDLVQRADALVDFAGGTFRDDSHLLGSNSTYHLFDTPKWYLVGSYAYPLSLVVGDFNGDGSLDIATANQENDNISIFLGNGDGTFAAAVHYDVGITPTSIDTGDFNGSGNLDLVVVTYGSAEVDCKVSILLGNGDGTFTAAANYDVGMQPFTVAVGDFNNDGNLDLAITRDRSNEKNLLILQGNGDGTFSEGSSYVLWPIPKKLAVGDFDGNGNLDLAVCSVYWGTMERSVSVLRGNGDGTFTVANEYSMGASNAGHPVVGDFNDDGNLDLAVGNGSSTNTISVFLGNGDGSFAEAVNYTAGFNTNALAVGDFTGNGILDLVATRVYTGHFLQVNHIIDLFLGVGDGTFVHTYEYPIGGT
jgi:hypothetical protein